MSGKQQKSHGAGTQAALIQGSVFGVLSRMAGGMMIGFFAVSAFNITDTYFVSQLGTNELAAMSFTFPVVMLVGGLTMGIGVGASTVISQAIGGGRHHEMQRLTTDSLLLAVVLVGVLITIGMLTIRPLFTALGATAETLPLVEKYMRIWYVGMIFLIVPMMGNNAIRATGDTFSPSMIMLADVGLNVILDPLLIFGLGPFPEMGIAGAALATVLSRAVALCASLYLLHWRKRMLTFERVQIAEIWRSWRRILHVGLPMAGTHMLMPVAAGVVTRMVAEFGTETVAAFGAGSRIERLAVLPVMALGASLGPFVGQNVGARLWDRLYEAREVTGKVALGWGGLMTITLIVLAGPISRLFSDDPTVCHNIVLYLYLAPLAFGFRGLQHIANASMNAISQPYHSVLATVLRLFVFTLPFAAVGGWLYGFKGLLIGLTLGEVFMGLICMRWILILFDRLAGKDGEQVPEPGVAAVESE